MSLAPFGHSSAAWHSARAEEKGDGGERKVVLHHPQMLCHARDCSALGAGDGASSAGHGKIAAFPPLWSVKELNGSFVVQDATGQPLAYVYFEGEPQRQMSMRLISRDKARRIAAERGEAAEAVAQRVNEAFVSRRAMMDRDMVRRPTSRRQYGDRQRHARNAVNAQ